MLGTIQAPNFYKKAIEITFSSNISSSSAFTKSGKSAFKDLRII